MTDGCPTCKTEAEEAAVRSAAAGGNEFASMRLGETPQGLVDKGLGPVDFLAFGLAAGAVRSGSRTAAQTLFEGGAKADVLHAVRGGAGQMTGAQRTTLLRHVQRATTKESISITRNANGTLTVLKTRPGADGAQTIVSEEQRVVMGSGQELVLLMKTDLARKLTTGEREALKQFATLAISVADFLARMNRVVRVGKFIGGEREIEVVAMPGEDVVITRDDIRWAVQRYVHGKTSGEELSHWAGLLLAIPAYVLPSADSDDDVLGLLNDLALPLKDEYLDRDELKVRIATI